MLWLVGPITPFRGIAPAIEHESVCNALDQHADIDVIVLRIDSPGGNANTAERIANRLMEHRARKVAIIDRSCMSGANRFAAAADRVLIRANAVMLLHRLTQTAHGNAEQIADQARAMRFSDSSFCRFVANRRGIPVQRLEQLLPLERFLTAREALDMGLAHDVIPPLPALVVSAGAPALHEKESHVQQQN